MPYQPIFVASGFGKLAGKVTENISLVPSRSVVALLATVHDLTIPKLTDDVTCKYKVKFPAFSKV